MTETRGPAWQADIPEEPVVPPATELEPTYPVPVDAVSVDEARVKIAGIIDGFLQSVVAPPQPGPNIFQKRRVSTCIKAPAGIGKTTLAGERVADLIEAGKTVMVAIPTHALGDQIVETLESDAGARVYRSRDALDPDGPEPDTKMCREPKRLFAIEGALGDVDGDACKSKRGICDHYNTCAFQGQKRNPPKLWLVAHQLLFRKLPDFIPKPDFLIIDESFGKAAIDTDIKLHIDWLINNLDDRFAFPRGLDGRNADNELLIHISKLAYEPLVDLGTLSKRSRISRDMFQHLTADQVKRAKDLEWNRKRHLDREYRGIKNDGDHPDMRIVRPGQPEPEAIEQADLRRQHNRRVKARAIFFEYVERLKAGESELSQNLYFRPHLEIDRERRPGILIKRRLELHEWVTDCDILHLDATMNEALVRRDLPNASFNHVNVEFPELPGVTHVEQITDCMMTTRSSVPVEGATDDRNLRREMRFEDIRATIALVAEWHSSESVVVICQEELKKKLRTAGVPKNVKLEHFNALRGRNDLKDCRALILVGRTEPGVRDMEDQARLVFGREVITIPEGGAYYDSYYDRLSKALWMRDGSAVTVRNSVHPDEAVEALRWLVCDAELEQAYFRTRPLTRTVANPLSTYILVSVALPIPVDRAVTWREMRPNLFQLMKLARGFAPDSPTDCVALFPKIFDSGVEAAKKALQRQRYVSPKLIKRFLAWASDGADAGMRGQSSVRISSNRGLSPHTQEPGLKLALVGVYSGGDWPNHRSATLKYRRAGSRANRPTTLRYDPTMAADPLAEMSVELGDLILIPTDDGGVQ
jgi:hypothetical protein